MKRLTLVMLSLLLVCSTLFGQSSGKRYKLKKAHVEYQISGSMQSGSEHLYFDDWGKREAKYTSLTIKVSGFTQENHKATFLEGKWIYAVDLTSKTGTKQENEMFKDLSDEELADLGKQTMIQMGGKKIGTETILGKRCEVWDIPKAGSKTWLWNWIPLKTEVNMGG